MPPTVHMTDVIANVALKSLMLLWLFFSTNKQSLFSSFACFNEYFRFPVFRDYQDYRLSATVPVQSVGYVRKVGT
jgi:hypothetical protein